MGEMVNMIDLLERKLRWPRRKAERYVLFGNVFIDGERCTRVEMPAAELKGARIEAGQQRPRGKRGPASARGRRVRYP